jgi:hypothetical protein
VLIRRREGRRLDGGELVLEDGLAAFEPGFVLPQLRS